MNLTPNAVLPQILTFISSGAHYLGAFFAALFNRVLPTVQIPADLVDPLGYLLVLTGFLVLVQVARKIAALIVVAGWVLMIVRIAMLHWGHGTG